MSGFGLAILIVLAIALPLIAFAILRHGRDRDVEFAADSAEDRVPAGPDFRPGTVRLLRSVGIEGPYAGDASDETYAVHRACVEIENRAFTSLSEEDFKKKPWPADAAVLDALRAALDEQAGTYAGHEVVHTLIRCGRTSADIVAGLPALKRMAFGWRERGYTGASIEAMLREAGIVQRLPESGIARIDGWIRDPLSALEQDASITALFFGPRKVIASLDDSGYEPRHDKLLAELAKAALPEVLLGDVRQEVPGERFKDVTATTLVAARDAQGVSAILSDRGKHWVVEYVHDGKPYGFLARCKATWMDLDAVLRHFDELMVRLHHPDRAFRIVGDKDDFWGHFIVAPRDEFPPLAGKLGIPLYPAPRRLPDRA